MIPGKTIAACCVYDDDSWLPVMVEGIYSAVDGIVFLVGRKPWNGDLGDTEGTISVIEALPDPQTKITVLRGEWQNETEQRNAGLDFASSREAEFCMVIDADEIYDPAAVLRMKQAMLQYPAVGAWYISMFTYWKSIEYRVEPLEQFQPAVFARPALARFAENRHLASEQTGVFPPRLAICHHLSYARTDEQVQKKLARFSHSHEILEGWYERVWKGWEMNPQMENIHPVYPGAYQRAVKQNPTFYPPALRHAFEAGKLR